MKRNPTWTAVVTEQYFWPVDLCFHSTPPGQQQKPTLLMLSAHYDFSLLCEVREERLELIPVQI